MPERTMPSAAPLPAESDPLIDELRRRGWPLTKAAYLHLMFAGEPTFPLDAEVASAVPPQLAGLLPSNSNEYWVAWIQFELARQAGLARQSQECRACGRQPLTEDARRLPFGWLCSDCLDLLARG